MSIAPSTQIMELMVGIARQSPPEEGEWPKRAAVPLMRKFPVTPEMIAAGGKAHDGTGLGHHYERIYRAMAALAPVELVPTGELAALRERDEALAKFEMLREQLGEWRTRSFRNICEATELRELVASRDARVAERDASVAWAIKRGSRP